MKVSIITTCFNSEKTIERTLKSVLNQTYTDIEYIIIDGGSTDKTLDIVREYEPKFNGRMVISSEPDKGIYDAMNKGIRKATGELVGLVNSDDYYEIDAVEIMVKAREKDPHDYQILYGFERQLKDGQETAIIINHHSNIKGEMITHPTCFITKKLYDDKGLYSLDYKYSADYEFMLRMDKESDVVFTPVYKLISNYALGGASGTGDAYTETMKLLHEYGIISDQRYRVIKLKHWIRRTFKI